MAKHSDHYRLVAMVPYNTSAEIKAIITLSLDRVDQTRYEDSLA